MSDQCTSNDCAGCPSADGCSEKKDRTDFSEQLNVLSRVGKVIGVVSGKGGVGKSLVTGLLAVETQRSGKNAAVLDADITGPSAAHMFGVSEKAMGSEAGIFPARTDSGIQLISINMMLEDEKEPVVWRGPVLASAVKQFWTDVIWNDVDVMYVDLPPGTGDVPLTVYQSLPLDGIIVVTTPQELVSMVVAKALRMAQMMGIPILGFVENMSGIVCPHCGELISVFGEPNTTALKLESQVSVADSIPISPELARLCDEGKVEETPEGLVQNCLRAVEMTPERSRSGE